MCQFAPGPAELRLRSRIICGHDACAAKVLRKQWLDGANMPGSIRQRYLLYLPTYLFIFLSILLPIYLAIFYFIYLSIHLSISVLFVPVDHSMQTLQNTQCFASQDLGTAVCLCRRKLVTTKLGGIIHEYHQNVCSRHCRLSVPKKMSFDKTWGKYERDLSYPP